MTNPNDPLDDARARGDILDDADADEQAAAGADADAGGDTDADPKGEKGAADDNDGDDSPPARKPQHMIPKVRFDEARRKDRERIKQLEAQLAEGGTRQPQPSVQQRTAAMEEQAAKLMDEYTKALDDGDTKKSATLLLQVRQLDREIARIEAAARSAHDSAIAVEQVRLDMLIDQLEEKYPQLREGSDEYDPDLVDEITDLRTAFESRGQASSDALRKAVKYVLRDEGRSARQVERDVDAAADKADKAADKAGAPDKATEVGNRRRAEAVRRNLAIKQPADTNKAPGLDSHKIGGGIDAESVRDMTERDFDALPDSTKRKLRGDFFSPTV